MDERRKEFTCDRHDAVIDALKEGNQNLAALREWRQNVTESQRRMEDKLDTMAEIQLAYVAETAQLKQIVTNGLSHNIQGIRERIDEICDTFGKRLEALETFSWFRLWMNKMRDDLFKNVFKIGVGVGLFYALIHFGDQIIKRWGF